MQLFEVNADEQQISCTYKHARQCQTLDLQCHTNDRRGIAQNTMNPHPKVCNNAATENENTTGRTGDTSGRVVIAKQSRSICKMARTSRRGVYTTKKQ
jgi:hypothetical protein